MSTIRNANIEHKEKLTRLEKFALVITARIGSMGFFFVIFFWTILWLTWNVFGPQALQFDPFPAFVLWLFMSNVIQIFLMPLLLIGQNLQGKHSEIRAETDFEIDMKAEHEVEKILHYLETQNALILDIVKKLEQK